MEHPHLIIHNSQLEVFRAVGIDQFNKKMFSFVRDKYGVKVAKINDETLKKDIAHLMQQAKGFGFKTEHDIMKYISHNYFYNWNGTISNEKILALFKNPSFLPRHKFHLVKGLIKK